MATPSLPSSSRGGYGATTAGASVNSVAVHHCDGEEETALLASTPPSRAGGGPGRSRRSRTTTTAATALVLVAVAFGTSLFLLLSSNDDRGGGGDSALLGSKFLGAPPRAGTGRGGGGGGGPRLLSALDPVDDLGFSGIDRTGDARPSDIWGDERVGKMALPTNGWYLNLISNRASVRPSDATRAYTVPYIVDTAPPGFPGIRVHWPVMQASDRNMQMVYDAKNGLSLGSEDPDFDGKYAVDESGGGGLSLLGVNLKWVAAADGDDDDDGEGKEKEKEKSMTAHVVRGMPFATMRYAGGVLPSIASGNVPASALVLDDERELRCGRIDGAAAADGETKASRRELSVHFENSDFTWMIFFSRPVRVRCGIAGKAGPGVVFDVMFRLDVVEYEDGDEPLTIQTALADACTTGKSDIHQHCTDRGRWADKGGYLKVLREGAMRYSVDPKVDFDYGRGDDDEEATTTGGDDEGGAAATVTFDWNVRNADETGGGPNYAFALPHHQSRLSSPTGDDGITNHCMETFHGSTCLVRGDAWTLTEKLGRRPSFTARRPPAAWAIPALAEALKKDVQYRISDNLKRGAADTYFSGKILARLGRVAVVAEELSALRRGATPEALGYDDVDPRSYEETVEAARSASLPTRDEIDDLVEQIKRGVQIWIDNNGEAPYVCDRSWGGLVNCGCRYEGEGQFGTCVNRFPDCPALTDVNVDFGNGYYNDHHYHYGYHLYAAAVAAWKSPAWARKYYEPLLLYVRDIANPSSDDAYFTRYRHKDWFLGSSWASGIVSAENSPHGRNEESSSEAIAAYEAVSLFGAAMAKAFGGRSNDVDDSGKLESAELVRDAGRLLTATEVSATNRYWHVWSSPDHVNAYPKEYAQPVVGMLYQTMGSFQTWFAPEDFVSYGIQLLPLTAVGEERDDPTWAADLYPKYEKSCHSTEEFCVRNGWTIIECGLLATAGRREEALRKVLEIPPEVFNSEGGVGNSLTNTIWYIATRKPVMHGGDGSDGK